MADLEYVRSRTRATVLVLWPRCHAHDAAGRRTVRCWRPMWHDDDHRYGVVTWPRSRAVWWRGPVGRIDQARALWRKLTWSPSKSARLASQRSPRWAFMERFEVPDYDRPERSYLTRWRVVQTPWFGIYVHRFDGPDPRPTLHDHPWPFLSIVLRGGYWEVTQYTLPTGRLIRRVNVKRATDLHYITRLDRTPTWTLMLVGRRCRTWGYTDRDGTWTPFDEHPHAAEFDAAMAARSRQ